MRDRVPRVSRLSRPPSLPLDSLPPALSLSPVLFPSQSLPLPCVHEYQAARHAPSRRASHTHAATRLRMSMRGSLTSRYLPRERHARGAGVGHASQVGLGCSSGARTRQTPPGGRWSTSACAGARSPRTSCRGGASSPRPGRHAAPPPCAAASAPPTSRAAAAGRARARRARPRRRRGAQATPLRGPSTAGGHRSASPRTAAAPPRAGAATRSRSQGRPAFAKRGALRYAPSFNVTSLSGRSAGREGGREGGRGGQTRM